MQSLPTVREYILMSALLPKERYGREIADEFERLTGTPLPLGSLYTTLDRMEAKRFVRSWFGDAPKSRQGNRRRYFRLTAEGRNALVAFELSVQSAGRLAHVRG